MTTAARPDTTTRATWRNWSGLEEATPVVTVIEGPERSVARPILVGTVHGLAGSAAVALLVLATIRDMVPAFIYLFVFGLGTIIGMVAVTVILAAPALYAGTRIVRLQGGIRLAAGALSIAFGLLLARELIVDGGLFSVTPIWNPH